jgi:hypothetical protein
MPGRRGAGRKGAAAVSLVGRTCGLSLRTVHTVWFVIRQTGSGPNITCCCFCPPAASLSGPEFPPSTKLRNRNYFDFFSVLDRQSQRYQQLI